MSNKTDPLSAILASARARLEDDSWIDEITEPDEDGNPNDYARRVVPLDDVFAALDRIAAAAERERAVTDAMLAAKGRLLPHPDPENAPPLFAAPGNAAALRAALSRAIDAIQTMIALYDEEHTAAVKTGATWERSDTSAVNAIVEQSRAALAAPARNCDRFGECHEAVDAWHREERCLGRHVDGGTCERDPLAPTLAPVCFAKWLFAPAEGGTEC